MNKIICLLVIIIGFSACDPHGSVICIVLNNSNNNIVLRFDSIERNKYEQENQTDSIIVAKNSSAEIYKYGHIGRVTLGDSVSFIKNIIILNDTIICKKDWRNVTNWNIVVKSKNGSTNNQYTLNLNDTDF